MAAEIVLERQADLEAGDREPVAAGVAGKQLRPSAARQLDRRPRRRAAERTAVRRAQLDDPEAVVGGSRQAELDPPVAEAAVEPYPGWGGYGSSKAALEQLTAILGAEHPELRVYAVDPGDMRTQMQQDAFPGEDISDRPPPEESVPGLLALIEGSLPSGRYRVRDLAEVMR